MKSLLSEIKTCDICRENLELGPRPVVSADKNSRVVLIGQAPGLKVHHSGKPWDDPSGKQLRKWLGVDDDEFYDVNNFALVPMGFCYPGKGKSGDLAPRPECAPLWHDVLLSKMPNVKLTVLIGSFAQGYYLKNSERLNLTETVKNYWNYEPSYFPIPHPSPRNRFWLTKNPWFENDVLPDLKLRVREALDI